MKVVMRYRLWIAILCGFLVSTNVNGQHKPIRPSDSVEVGPTLDFTYGIGQFGRAYLEAGLREFIWEHWAQRRRGRIAAIFHGIDGPPKKHSFEIRQDKKGSWILVSKVERSRAWYQMVVGWKWKTERFEIFDVVDRVEPTTMPRSFSGTLPNLDGDIGNRLELVKNSGYRSPDKYRLFFQSRAKADSDLLF